MPFPPSSVNTAPKPFFIISFLLILSHYGFITVTTKGQNENNGADPFRTACAEWEIPTEGKPMRIGVPNSTHFQNFVKVNLNETSDEEKYEGFCIDIFKEVLKVLYVEKNYTLHYKFEPSPDGTYAGLLEGVANGSFDAAVGDITIVADRSRYVEFTQPYMESRLVMIAPAKSQHKAWKFLKPFTVEMWIATGVILIYTMFIVWSLERGTNPEFKGPLKDQLSTALWFTFSSLFFSHRERIHSSFTRVVVMVWLFVVLVLNSSYTASLTSMLTVSQLEPKETTVDWLLKTNSSVGYSGDSFVVEFLKNEYKFKPENIKIIWNGNRYEMEFESGNIAAAFLELPYGKDFVSRNSKRYAMTEPKYKRFGGFGFAFKKCSPIATNVSEVILTLVENGQLNWLERKWFGPSFNDSDRRTAANEVESLSLQSFWGLYLITGATSTILCLIHLLQNCRRRPLWGLYLNTGATSSILCHIHLLQNCQRRLKEFRRLSNNSTHPRPSPTS